LRRDLFCKQETGAAKMDDLNTLANTGLGLPSPAYLFGAVLFGIIGFAAYRYGKKAEAATTKWLGVVLMIYPYGVSETWLLYVVGIALCVIIYFYRG
jgi:hypothetical protein